MVRHVDAIDLVFECQARVLGGGDPLQDQRDPAIALDPLDIAPIELGLIGARIAGAHAAALVALSDVALAPAVTVGVDDQAECVIAAVDGAADMVVDPIGVAAHVKLKNLAAAARSLGGFVHPGMRHRRQDHAVAELASRCRHRGAAARIEHFERADRRAQHRDAQFAAEQLAAAFNL